MDMAEGAREILLKSVEVLQRSAQDLPEVIADIATALLNCLSGGGKVLLFGNGGSAADAQHIAAEFVGRFQRPGRAALAGIALTTDTSVLTSVGNDFGFAEIFARQIQALGKPGDVAIGLSTSGQSANVLKGIAAASELGLLTIAFTGSNGGELAKMAQIALRAPHTASARIQEVHIACAHAVCELVEEALLGESQS